MTILPKKKPASTAGGGGGDHKDEPDRRSGSEPHSHPLTVRSGSRPRASPPPWSYQATPHTSREERRIESSARPQPSSPQPGAAGAPVAQCEGSTNLAVVGSRVELPCGTGGSCCSGPGLSKRRRQTVCSSGLTGGGGRGGGGGGGSPASDPEEGAGGNNSEDEYENAARLQLVDPTTVEQVLYMAVPRIMNNSKTVCHIYKVISMYRFCLSLSVVLALLVESIALTTKMSLD